jgi:hypothetical protein
VPDLESDVACVLSMFAAESRRSVGTVVFAPSISFVPELGSPA